jgi:hypothetical protein
MDISKIPTNVYRVAITLDNIQYEANVRMLNLTDNNREILESCIRYLALRVRVGKEGYKPKKKRELNPSSSTQQMIETIRRLPDNKIFVERKPELDNVIEQALASDIVPQGFIDASAIDKIRLEFLILRLVHNDDYSLQLPCMLECRDLSTKSQRITLTFQNVHTRRKITVALVGNIETSKALEVEEYCFCQEAAYEFKEPKDKIKIKQLEDVYNVLGDLDVR